MRFYLIRHGQTDWNLAGRLQGKTDIELNETGLWQAGKLAVFMKDKPIVKIYTSPLLRAVSTAKILGRSQNAGIMALRGIEEMCLGEWEGLTWEEVKGRYPKAYLSYQLNPMENAPPGGENYLNVIKRCSQAMEAMLEHEGGDFAVISHGLTIGCILTWLFRDQPETIVEIPVPNTSVTTLEYNRLSKDIQLVEAGRNDFL